MSELNINDELDNNNKIIIKIFNLIKLQDWNSLKNIIEHNDIDYNIKDPSGMYLLEYLIIFNKIDIITLLFDKNIRIDILDEHKRSILYSVIKFSYIDILKLLLDKNKELIGINILEIKDNTEDIALFYAIRLSNMECIKIILDYTRNINIRNKDGDNALHIAVKLLNTDVFKLINTKINDINQKNNNGETILHLIIIYKCFDMLEYVLKTYKNINFNIIDYIYNFTILHYICINLDYKSLLLVKKYTKYMNGNIQDKSGNIFYHYFIKNIYKDNDPKQIENYINMFNIFKNIDVNMNLYNIDNNTTLHLLASNIDFFVNNKMNVMIDWIISKTHINIQNYHGETCLFLIVKSNYWKHIKDLLISKKLDIFITTYDKETMFQYIDSKDIDTFLDIITKSYIDKLRKYDAIKWLDYWDNRCKRVNRLIYVTILYLIRSKNIL